MSSSYAEKKVNLDDLDEDNEDLKIILFFRPSAKTDPTYRRVSMASIEYMKDVKAQLIDAIQRQKHNALEPPDTDSEMGQYSNMQLSGGIEPNLLIQPNNAHDTLMATDTPPISAGRYSAIAASTAVISSYSDLLVRASRQGSSRSERYSVNITSLDKLDLEPLFEHMSKTARQPLAFVNFQDIHLFLLSFHEDGSEDRRLFYSPNSSRAKHQSSNSSASWSRSNTSVPGHECNGENITLQSQEHTRIYVNNNDEYLRQSNDIWRKNLIYYINTANTIMGDFHGTLPYYWLNRPQLDQTSVTVVHKLPKIPTLEELDRSGFSINAYPRIKGGIKIIDKSVFVQIISMLDFRYREMDMQYDNKDPVWGYYKDSIIKLSKLIPNKRSYDVAVDVGIIPADMTLLVDFSWWTHNIIKFGYDLERSQGQLTIGKDTYNLFVSLNNSYYCFWKTIKRDMREQMKYNPVQFVLNITTTVLTLASLIFATTGVLQVLQGFDVFE